MEKSPTVLVVDDSKSVLLIVERTLQHKGIRVITASDGLTALTRMIDEMPAMVLLDVQLPHLDGYSICQVIKKHVEFQQTPIIMLSGKDGIFDKMRGRLAGATEYLTKPFDPTSLLETVTKYLANWEERVPAHHEEMRRRTRSWKKRSA